MKLNFDRSQKHLVDAYGEKVNTTVIPNRPHAVFASMGYRWVSADSNRMLIDKRVIDEHYEVVEDLIYSDFNRKLGSFFAYHQCYKSKKYDYYIHIDPDLSDPSDYYDYDFVNGVFRLDAVFFEGSDLEACENMSEELNSLFVEDKKNEAVIYIVLKTLTGYELKRKEIDPLEIDIDKMYNDDFRPVYDNVVKNLTDTGKGIVLFHGDAGTGKTNLIKNLTFAVPDKKFVYITHNLIPYLDDPAFISLLIDNKGLVLILEDSEAYLKDRVETNNNVVSSLLNLSDGILSDILKLQIIATFNADIQKIDTAFLRKGRLIAEYEFGPLDTTKAKAIAEEYGIEGEINSPMTIAEIFNMNDGSSKTQKERKAIGFGK